MNRDAVLILFFFVFSVLLSLSYPTHLCSTVNNKCVCMFGVFPVAQYHSSSGVVLRYYAATNRRYCNIFEMTKTKYKTPITIPFICFFFLGFFFLFLKNVNKLVENVCLFVPESSCIWLMSDHFDHRCVDGGLNAPKRAQIWPDWSTESAFGSKLLRCTENFTKKFELHLDSLSLPLSLWEKRKDVRDLILSQIIFLSSSSPWICARLFQRLYKTITSFHQSHSNHQCKHTQVLIYFGLVIFTIILTKQMPSFVLSSLTQEFL